MDLAGWSKLEAERRLAPLGARWAHTQGVVVRAKAMELMAPPADRETLMAAAYLHDIGYADQLRDSGFHPLDGARWLRTCGQERLAGLGAHPTGARFEAEVRGFAAELGEFPEERSMVSDLLAYCDLTTGPDGDEVTFAARLAEIQERYGAESDVARSIEGATSSLAEIVSRVERRAAEAQL